MRIQVIVNQRARLVENLKQLSVMKNLLGRQLAALTFTSSARQALELIRSAPPSDIDTVIMVGGDGTINGILDGLVESAIALGVVPSGTANDLAAVCALPKDITAACKVILQRQIRAVDLIAVNGRHFVTGGGFGLPATVAAKANNLKNRQRAGHIFQPLLGDGIYVMSALAALFNDSQKQMPLTVGWQRNTLTRDCLSLTIANQSLLGGHFRLSPGAANDDGLFDVCLIENSHRRLAAYVTLAQTLVGTHVRLPSVTNWRSRELTVRSPTPLSFFADGELLASAQVFSFRILPQSLNLIVPTSQRSATLGSVAERDGHAFNNE
jgi:YegS/Rv2252/BmrU family lipid kinase